MDRGIITDIMRILEGQKFKGSLFYLGRGGYGDGETKRYYDWGRESCH